MSRSARRRATAFERRGSKIETAADMIDAAYFRSHPDRQYRMRRPLTGEAKIRGPSPYKFNVVIVQRDGARLRRYMIGSHAASVESDNDDWCELLFILTDRAVARGEYHVHGPDIVRTALAISATVGTA